MRDIPVLRKEVPYAEEEARAQTALNKSQTQLQGSVSAHHEELDMSTSRGICSSDVVC